MLIRWATILHIISVADWPHTRSSLSCGLELSTVYAKFHKILNTDYKWNSQQSSNKYRLQMKFIFAYFCAKVGWNSGYICLLRGVSMCCCVSYPTGVPLKQITIGWGGINLLFLSGVFVDIWLQPTLLRTQFSNSLLVVVQYLPLRRLHTGVAK